MPKVSLSNLKVERLKVQKTTLYWDREIPGFVLRVTPNGAKTLLFVYKHPDTGQQRKVRLGAWTIPGFKTHRARAATMRCHVDEGYDPIEFDKAEVEADRLTFQAVLKGTEPLQEVFDQFIQSRRDLRRSERTIRDYEGDWRRYVKPALGAKALRDVKRADIADLHRKMSSKPVRANRTLVMLHGLFEFALEQEMRPEGDNPCRRVKKYPEQPRSRYYDDLEIEAILDALDNVSARGDREAVNCLRLQLLTGARGIEIRTLRWGDIDFRHRMIRLLTSKTGKRRGIPLNAPAWSVLEGMHGGGDHIGLVFPGSRTGKPISHSTVDKAWRRVRKAAGLEDAKAHDLRHAFATRAANRLPTALAMRLTGHTSLAAFQRYLDADEAAIR